MSHGNEIKIRLSDKAVELLKKGKLTIDIEQPPESVEVFDRSLDEMGLSRRALPSGENNFRKHQACCDCIGFKRRHASYSCAKKTFSGECYMLFAISQTCDVFAPKLVSAH